MFDLLRISYKVHTILLINLIVIGSLSIIFSQVVLLMSIYLFTEKSYLVINSLYTHHM